MGEQLFQFEPWEVRRIFAGEYEIRYELTGHTCLCIESVAYAGKQIGVSDILEYILSKWLFVFYSVRGYGAGSGGFFGDEVHISPDVDIKNVRENIPDYIRTVRTTQT